MASVARGDMAASLGLDMEEFSCPICMELIHKPVVNGEMSFNLHLEPVFVSNKLPFIIA